MKKNNHNIRYQILNFLIVFTPWLEPYKWNGIDLDTLALFFTIFFSFTIIRNKWRLNYNFKPFLFYGIIVPPIISIIYGLDSNIKSSYIILSLYTLFVGQISNNLSLKYFIKYYRILVYIAICVFVLQEIMFVSVGYRFSALIPFLDLKYNFTTMQNFIITQMFFPRSSSVFLEPSHFAQYIVPYFAYSLSKNTEHINFKRFVEPVLLLLVFFFLKSGCGIVCSIAILSAYVPVLRISVFKKVIFFICGIIVFPLLFNRIAASETGEQILNRTEELEVGNNYNSSGTQRIFRGFYVYEEESPILKIFGVGTGGCIDVINQSSARMMFNSNERYINNVHTLLIGFGFIGTLLFIIHIFSLYRLSTLDGKLIMIGFIALCFMESFFLNSKMILYIGFIYALINNKPINNSKYIR